MSSLIGIGVPSARDIVGTIDGPVGSGGKLRCGLLRQLHQKRLRIAKLSTGVTRVGVQRSPSSGSLGSGARRASDYSTANAHIADSNSSSVKLTASGLRRVAYLRRSLHSYRTVSSIKRARKLKSISDSL